MLLRLVLSRALKGKRKQTIHFLRFDLAGSCLWVYAPALKSAYLPADIPYPALKEPGVGAKLSVDSAGKELSEKR